MSEFSAIGQPRPIIDGKAKVSGTAQYVTDLQLPGMLHARGKKMEQKLEEREA